MHANWKASELHRDASICLHYERLSARVCGIRRRANEARSRVCGHVRRPFIQTHRRTAPPFLETTQGGRQSLIDAGVKDRHSQGYTTCGCRVRDRVGREYDAQRCSYRQPQKYT